MSEGEARHRFFVESLEADAVALPGGEAHHARGVLRLSGGEPVEVFDGSGTVAVGTLRPVGRKGARVEITGRRGEPAPAPPVELAFAVPKGRRLDWLIEKATELGASALAPVVFERSVSRPSWTDHARRRWRATCVAAAKQSAAARLPGIAPPAPLAAYLTAAGAERRLLADADGEAFPGPAGPRRDGPADRAGRTSWAVLVGPEGGLTSDERRAALAAGFAPVRLGGRTLRVETAAVAFLAAIRALAGG